MKYLLLLLLMTVAVGCDVNPGPVDIDTDMPDFTFNPTYTLPDMENKELTTITTKDELPKLEGDWMDFCHEELLPYSGIDSKVGQLLRKQKCGFAQMKIDSKLKTLDFDFGKGYFDYLVSVNVPSCPDDTENCVCTVKDDVKYKITDEIKDADKECKQHFAKSGQCTMTVKAEIEDTLSIETTSPFSPAPWLNNYIKISSLQIKVQYLNDHIKNTKVPDSEKQTPTKLQLARLSCDNFAEFWQNKSTAGLLLYNYNEFTDDLAFPQNAKSMFSTFLTDTPMMGFKKK